MHADTGIHAHNGKKKCEALLEYANKNNSKEMLHYLRRLCDELHWQHHTSTIYNSTCLSIFFILIGIYLYELSKNTGCLTNSPYTPHCNSSWRLMIPPSSEL